MDKSKYQESLKILNLTVTAKLSNIKKAYRKMVKIYHPDKYQNSVDKEIAEEKLKKINDAYHYLIDNYDENLDLNGAEEKTTSESFDFDDVDAKEEYQQYQQYQTNSSSIDKYFCVVEKQRIMPLWAKIIIYLLFNSLAFVIYYLFS